MRTESQNTLVLNDDHTVSVVFKSNLYDIRAADELAASLYLLSLVFGYTPSVIPNSTVH